MHHQHTRTHARKHEGKKLHSHKETTDRRRDAISDRVTLTLFAALKRRKYFFQVKTETRGGRTGGYKNKYKNLYTSSSLAVSRVTSNIYHYQEDRSTRTGSPIVESENKKKRTARLRLWQVFRNPFLRATTRMLAKASFCGGKKNGCGVLAEFRGFIFARPHHECSRPKIQDLSICRRFRGRAAR